MSNIDKFPQESRRLSQLSMEFIKNFFMICSPSGEPISPHPLCLSASGGLSRIRSEAPRLHGLRLSYAANSAREKYGLGIQILFKRGIQT